MIGMEIAKGAINPIIVRNLLKEFKSACVDEKYYLYLGIKKLINLKEFDKMSVIDCLNFKKKKRKS